MNVNPYVQARKVRALFDPVPPGLADRIVAALPQDTEDPAAVAEAAAVALLGQPDDGRPVDAYRLGLRVADHFGLDDDYDVQQFAQRFGRAFITARRVLADAPAVPVDDRAAWDEHVVSAVAVAVSGARPSRTVIVRVPANARRVTS